MHIIIQSRTVLSATEKKEEIPRTLTSIAQVLLRRGEKNVVLDFEWRPLESERHSCVRVLAFVFDSNGRQTL